MYFMIMINFQFAVGGCDLVGGEEEKGWEDTGVERGRAGTS